VIGVPPLEAGGCHCKSTVAPLAVAPVNDGAPGAVAVPPTFTFSENSDVLPALSVAVAVTHWPLLTPLIAVVN
jgi:hypothetical protein